MENLNNTTKKACSYIARYNASNDRSLRDVYGHYSEEKENAYNDCISTFREKNGKDFRIFSANCYTFSCGFRYEEDGIKKLCIITPSHDYSIIL